MKNNQILPNNKTELDQFYTNPLTAKKLTSIFTGKRKKSKSILGFFDRKHSKI